MKLSTIGTNQIAVRDAKAALDSATQAHLDGKLGWGAVLIERAAYDAAVAQVAQDILDYDANPEPEV